jgi:hypothetical protein
MKEEEENHVSSKTDAIKTKDALKRTYAEADKSDTFDITEKTQEHDERI